MLYGITGDVQVLFHLLDGARKECGLCGILLRSMGRFNNATGCRGIVLFRTGFLLGLITVALLYKVADAEQKNFFLMPTFHLFAGPVDVKSDADYCYQ